jgi:dihydrofolate reductase
MRKLIVAEHISLDGVVQAPGGPEEDPSQGFAFGGWSAPFSDDAIGQTVLDLHAEPFELLLGRRTYDIWADYWPNVPSGNPIADPFNRTIKHVATHRPESLGWHNSRALAGNLADTVHALKQSEGPDLLTWGSSDMVRQLLAKQLVDELCLILYPVVLGNGKRLYDGGAMPSTFSLESLTQAKNGVVLARYRITGEVRTGRYT